VEDALKYGDFKDLNYYEELRKDTKDRNIKMTELLRPEAVEVWKRFSQMPDRAKY
jgi:guanine deaminase